MTNPTRHMASALTNNELSTYLQVLTLLRQRQRAQQAQHARTHQLLEQILTAVAEQQHAIHATILQLKINLRTRIHTIWDELRQACARAVSSQRSANLEQSVDPPLMVYLRWPTHRFIKIFRVTPTLFDEICNKIRGIVEPASTMRYVSEQTRTEFPLERKVATCLWHLAHGGEWNSTAGVAACSPSTVKVSHAMVVAFAPAYFKVRRDPQARDLIWERFGDRRRIGSIRLALDGSHVPFSPLDKSVNEDYKNYKGFTSILVRHFAVPCFPALKEFRRCWYVLLIVCDRVVW